MAEIIVPANDPTAVVAYSTRVFQHAIRTCKAAQLMAAGLSADSQTNIVQLFTELSKGPGEKINYDLIPNPVGPGVLGDAVIAGQETKWSAFQDSLIIDQQRQAELLKGRMSQQRVPYSMRNVAKIGLANWWKEIFDVALLNQLCGNTAQTNVLYTGLQAPVAPDAAHWKFAGTATAEGGGTPLTSAMTMSIQYIPDLVAMAQSTLTFPIKPIVLNGVQVDGVLFLHPLQVRDMKKAFTAGEWGDIQKAALTGGQISGNPLFTGAIGMYDNVVIHQDSHVPWGDNTQNVVFAPVTNTNVPAPTSLGAAATGTTSVARGVFCGAQAAAIAFGAADNQEGRPLRVRWYEELLDAGNQLRVTSGMVYGIKKTRFNSQDYATIALSTWAAP